MLRLVERVTQAAGLVGISGFLVQVRDRMVQVCVRTVQVSGNGLIDVREHRVKSNDLVCR